MQKILLIIISLCLLTACAAKDEGNIPANKIKLDADEIIQSEQASAEALYLISSQGNELASELVLDFNMDPIQIGKTGACRISGIIQGKIPKAYIEINGRLRGFRLGEKVGEYSIVNIQTNRIILRTNK